MFLRNVEMSQNDTCYKPEDFPLNFISILLCLYLPKGSLEKVSPLIFCAFSLLSYLW
jgi:hypothetical protein